MKYKPKCLGIFPSTITFPKHFKNDAVNNTNAYYPFGIEDKNYVMEKGTNLIDFIFPETKEDEDDVVTKECWHYFRGTMLARFL